METLGQRVGASVRVYLVGGASAVLEGWRKETVDIDIELAPDSDVVLREIPAIKNELSLSVELASPAHFIPELLGWRERSQFIERHGTLDFFHYDFYSQALAKISRGTEKDLGDVRAMMARGLVEPKRAWGLFHEIEPRLYRYPALDPAFLKAAVEDALGPEG